MFATPYRERAKVSKGQREQLDDLLKVTAPHERVFLAGIGVSILLFLCWMVFGSVTRTLSIDGILIESGPRFPVESISDGLLETYLVAEGERLDAGDPVARQTVSALEKREAVLREIEDSVVADIGEAGGDALESLQASIRKSLLRLEAKRVARGLIVSQRSGVVMTLLHSPGEELAAGDRIAWIRAGSELPPRVIAQVPGGVARRMEPGMPVMVTVELSHQPPRQFSARVADTTVSALPEWLTPGGPVDHNGPLQRVDFLFDADDVIGVPDGTPVKVRVMLEQHSPATLLVRSRP